jgi:hypothetical protein
MGVENPENSDEIVWKRYRASSARDCQRDFCDTHIRARQGDRAILAALPGRLFSLHVDVGAARRSVDVDPWTFLFARFPSDTWRAARMAERVVNGYTLLERLGSGLQVCAGSRGRL